MKTALAIARIRSAKIDHNTILFSGGLDLETPPLLLPPGFLRSSQNAEADVLGGYARVMGYERFSGKPAPSSASAVMLDVTITGAIAVGDTVTDATSGATAVVVAKPDAAHIVVTKIAVSTFAAGHVLNVGGVAQATLTSGAHGAATAQLRAQYKNLAADYYRSLIAAPSGSGSNLGGVKFAGTMYTFRNNAGATAVDVWKSSATGWQQVPLLNEIAFTAGGASQPEEGTTLTQGGVTAVIRRVVITSLVTAWATNSATGRLILDAPAGGNFAAGAATVGAINLTLSAAQAPIVLLPGGRYEFIIENFAGGSGTNRIYGVDGVNRGFEFDGAVLVPISTGMASDAPQHVYSHKGHLFYSFGPSVQHSGPGTPYVWSVILGAAELGMGENVTGFMTQPGSESVGALAIFTRNRTSILYGTGVSNWQLIRYRPELGAYAFTVRDVGYTIYLDDQGITNMQAVQAFGNFSHAALSARIRRWVIGKRAKVVDSCVVRDKSQYRMFFSDNYALYSTLQGKKGIACMPVKLAHTPTWAWSSEESDGSESIYFGATDGMVYQMERGTSFDGESIGWHINLSWNNLKSPGLIKHFQGGAVEVHGQGYAEFDFTYRLGYASTEIPQPGRESEVTDLQPAVWNEGIQWGPANPFRWNGTDLLPVELEMAGDGENVSVIFRGDSDYQESIRFSGMRTDFSPRRYIR